MVTRRDQLLRNLALAVAMRPNAGIQQLGEAAGVSKATLYRLAPTREQLIDLLYKQAAAAGKVAMDKAGIDTLPAKEALNKFTELFVADADIYAYGFGTTRYEKIDEGALDRYGPEWKSYENRMLRLFERGQHEGVFRLDLTPDWMLLAYDALLRAVTMGLLQGHLARTSAAAMVTKTFDNGTERTT